VDGVTHEIARLRVENPWLLQGALIWVYMSFPSKSEETNFWTYSATLPL
jgi:hypothetical protein